MPEFEVNSSNPSSKCAGTVGITIGMAARIGYFGREGSFSHLAAQRRFPRADLAECPTVEESFARLEAGEFPQIVVPIENGSSGIITNTADQLMRLVRSDAAGRLLIR